MKRRYIKNERGDFEFLSVFIILSINMLLSFLLLYASIQINCINIRNAAKMELNNVSARIYADTFHSQREANLTSYMADIHLSAAYQNALEAGFINGLTERIPLEIQDYTISDISLNFNQYTDKIEYVVNCTATFYIRMFGDVFPSVSQEITLTGSHNTKF